MSLLLDDLRLTFRRLRRSPGFVLTAVATLTLAIAANVVVAGVANGLLFHSLPVPNPQQLVQIQNPGADLSISYPNYRDLRDRSASTFSSVALARLTRTAMTIDRAAQPVWVYGVTGNYFPMLEVKAELGRLFLPSDDVARNGSSTLVLSDTFWRTRFHADPNVIGRHILVGGNPLTIIGVAPRGFHGTEQFVYPAAWFPFHDGWLIDGNDNFERRGSSNAWAFGRMNDGVSRTQADVDLRRISQQMAKDFPKTDKGTAWQTAPVGLLGNLLATPVRAFIFGVALLSCLVLLAACANLGVLFSSRTLDRARELGVRLALGSTRTRILRQLAAEAAIITTAGGLAAAFVSKVLLHALSRWGPPSDLPVQVMVDADARVYVAAALLAGLTGLLFALLPARQIWRTDPNDTLRGTGTTNSTTDRSIFRSSLLIVQIAICCLLVIAAATAFRGLERTSDLPLGLRPQGLTLISTDVALAGHHDANRDLTQQQLLAAVRAIPGVTSAAYSNSYPLNVDRSTNEIFPVGTTIFDQSHVLTNANIYSVSPGWFNTVGAGMLEGRDFTSADDAAAPGAAILNQHLSQQLFGNDNPIGRTIPTGPGKQLTVVGVVNDGKYTSLTEDQQPAIFRPILQRVDSTAVLFARSHRPGAEMTRALRQAVASVDPNLPVFNAVTMSDALSLVTFPAQAATAALGAVGLLAAVLALTGIFGVASYSVSRRMRELGIRVALGARTNSILQAALGRTILLLVIGSALGFALGLAATHLLASIVYHASSADPVVLVVAALTMVAVGAIASVVPALRAIRIEPTLLLRQE